MTKGISLIRFDTRAIEDRIASLAAGHYVAKEIEIAIITPVGGRLEHEKEITDVLLKSWKNTPEDRYRFDAYQAWKDGAEPPVNGCALRNWPPISPAQLKELNARNIRSIEELAELPDDYLPSFGPGYRALRDKAREWLKSSNDIGKVVAEMAMLKEKLAARDESDKKKDELIDQLFRQLDEKENIDAAADAAHSPRRGRTSKSAAA